MRSDAGPAARERVRNVVAGEGCTVQEIPGTSWLAVTGPSGSVSPDRLLALPGVESVIPVARPYRLAAREAKASRTVVSVGNLTVGGGELAIIAGPCAVESRDQVLEVAHAVRAAGAGFFRGGAFKPRTSPYDFQGMKEEGLALLREVRALTGLPVVTEARDGPSLHAVAESADIIQIGARNMQNVPLLEAAGELRKPVLLKRGIAATVEELLLAAEYILARGNPDVILCERGIRTFERGTRNTLDLNAIPLVRKLSHLPMLVDPSHGIGMLEGVAAMALAGVAAGADGLLIEVHPDPGAALSDGYQSLTPQQFRDLMEKVRALAPIVGRTAPPAVDTHASFS